MGAGAGALAPEDEAEDQTWVIEAVSDAWLSPDWQTAVNEFYDQHCDQFAAFAGSRGASGGGVAGEARRSETNWQGWRRRSSRLQAPRVLNTLLARVGR